ncbi:restriction endonuclease subunit S [Helicobacter pylori]
MDALMLPLNWQRVRLGDICEIVKGQQINKISLNNTDKYPVINGGIDFLGYTNKFNVSKNTIAISEGGTCGYVRFMTSNFWSGGHNYSLQKISNKVNNLCLYHILKSYEKDIMKLGVGSGLKNIQLKALKDFKIPLPPLNEQIAIANILSDLDRYLCTLDALILKKEGVKKALRIKMLNQILASNGVEFKKIGEICLIKRGRVIAKKILQENGKYPVYSSQTLNNGILGFIDTYDFDGEFLTWTTDGAYAGSVFYRNGRFSITNVCGLLQVIQDNILHKYLYYILQITAPLHVNPGMGNPKLMSAAIQQIEIPLPPLNEQSAIANILSALDNEIAGLKNKKRQFENIKKALNHDLMSAKIRVLEK